MRRKKSGSDHTFWRFVSAFWLTPHESKENQKQSDIRIGLLNIRFWLEFLFRFVALLYGLQRSITQMSVLRSISQIN